MISVRHAKVSDVPFLIPMAREFFQESAFKDTFGFTEKEDDTMIWLAQIAKQPEYGFFVAHNDKEPVGFLIVGLRPWVMNFKEVYAFELFYYVDKKFRKGKASRSLIAAYEEWAKGHGCVAIEFGLTESLKGPKMAKFLERLGYKAALRSHVKRLGVENGSR